MTTFFDRTVRGQGAVSQQEASAFIAMVDRETSDLETGHIKGNLAGIREILVERPAVLPVIKPALAQLEAARYLAFADDYDARVYRKSESYSDFNRFLDSNPFNAKWGRCPLGRAATTGEPTPPSVEFVEAVDWGRAVAGYARCLSLQVRSGSNGSWRARRNAFVAAVDEVLQVFPELDAAAETHAGKSGDGTGSPLLSAFVAALFQGLQATNDPLHFLTGRLSSKINYAVVHHRCAYLNGRNLADWFQDPDFSVEGLLHGMQQARWLDSEEPENSRFFRSMTDFGQPMHGVFDEDELAAFADWVRHPSAPAQLPCPDRRGLALPKAVVEALDTKSQARQWKRSAADDEGAELQRSLFRELIENPVDATVQERSHDFLRSQLQRIRERSVATDIGEEFDAFDYSPEALRMRVDEIYNRQQRTSPQREPLPLRVLARLHLNSSPVSLVDGCWLGFVPLVCDPQSTWGRNLYRIYLEEIGSGTRAYNHAVMFEELLHDLGIDLPHFGHADYAESSEIPGSYFTVATTMLALGVHGAAFIPETLGFTLSVEMFGLGTAYEVMHHQLRNHGINAAFWTAHISIDNLSNGHSYLACEAVRAYLDDLRALGIGGDAIAETWRRIWDGMILFRLLIGEAYVASQGLTGRPVPTEWTATLDERCKTST